MNQILCCIAWRPEWAKEVIELAHDRRNDFPCAIVGVDIAAGEDHFNEVSARHVFGKDSMMLRNVTRRSLQSHTFAV